MPQQRNGFRTKELIVYPTHGVGQIVAIEENEIETTKLELFVINFEKERMTVRVPTEKSNRVGMRKLSDAEVVKKALATLKGKSQPEPRFWNERVPEYKAKINSGSLVAVAEVVRDLYRSEFGPEKSYTRRELFETALNRMASEIAAVQEMSQERAANKIQEILISKFARTAA